METNYSVPIDQIIKKKVGHFLIKSYQIHPIQGLNQVYLRKECVLRLENGVLIPMESSVKLENEALLFSRSPCVSCDWSKIDPQSIGRGFDGLIVAIFISKNWGSPFGVLLDSGIVITLGANERMDFITIIPYWPGDFEESRGTLVCGEIPAHLPNSNYQSISI